MAGLQGIRGSTRATRAAGASEEAEDPGSTGGFSSWQGNWPRQAVSEVCSHEACSATESRAHRRFEQTREPAMSSDLWWVKGSGTSRGEHTLHDAGHTVTDTKLRATARGGRVGTPRVQGCSTTSETSVGPGRLPEGARQTDVSEFSRRPGNSPQAESNGVRPELTTAKRIVLLLNVSPQPQETASFQASGITGVHLLGFGAPPSQHLH